MQNIFDIYLAINFITDKVRNGYCTPPDVSIALDLGQQQLHDEYLNWLGRDQNMTNSLQPFIKTVSVTSDINGFIPLPEDFAGMPDSALMDDLYRSFTTINNNEVRHAVSSFLIPITEYPRYLKTDNGLQLYPREQTALDFRYVKKPVSPLIGYSVVGNEIVYDPNTSVQLGFDSNEYLKVMMKALPYLGVNLSDSDVVGLAAQYNSSTQVPA